MVNTLFLPELREMLAERNAHDLQEFVTALNPARLAEYMEGLDASEAWEVLQHAELKLREDIFLYFTHERQIEIIETQDRAGVAELLADLPADDRVDLLHDVQEEVVEELLPLLPADERRELLRLRAYAPDSAGAMMTTEMAMIEEDLSVRDALVALSREAEHVETIYYIYVVDHDLHLRGVVSARQLVSSLGKPDLKVGDLMETDLILVNATDNSDEVTRLVERYDLQAIPVVDNQRRLVGIITHDDVLDAVRQEATDDAQQMAGIAPLEDDYLKTGLVTLAWKRGIWLTILFVAASVTATTLDNYESKLQKWAWLMMFVPMIMSSGGNSGNQSATLIITAMTAGGLSVKDWRKVVVRELCVGLMLGTILATFGGILSTVLTISDPGAREQFYWPFVIPVTLVLVVTSGAVAGSLLPLMFKRLGLDPALMSNPFVAGISDILGIVIYMTVSMLLLR
ncbi:Magnesium transporter MgtE [Anatilimnocola aggregata]|uniref:Magnesium transporter MgtE n=1 Tax=Anatilimnocola aggregata TaxID=2528021 RepID=A0A517YIC8_9BACT|nr:magnesium transporter [Anatilimnocola aggregata]QDU29979.1 Magnesium transporter MgtE [Anatilimnocola aggregata]